MSPPPSRVSSRAPLAFPDVTPLSAPAVLSAGDPIARRHEPAEWGRHQAVAASRYFRIKPAVDRTAAAVLAIIALPAVALVALAVLLCDGRPIFYRQSRVGKNGRPFLIWKFRTMYREAECQTGPVWSCEADQRVTPLGRWLRLSHLDELPQILNVLCGEMSLIGPRPERPEFVDQLALELPTYLQRLQVRPGITGLAQLQLGYDRCVADVRHKVELDLLYIRTATLATDLALMLRTVPHVLDEVWRQRRPSRGKDACAVAQQPGTPIPHHPSWPMPSGPAASSLPMRVAPRKRTA